MTAVYHDLAAGDFSQDWTNTALIATNDNWSGVPSIVGFRGDELTATTGTDPQTVLAPSTVVNVLANQTTPNTVNTGAVGEFNIANPVVALQGSGTADAPHLVLHLDGSGRQDITVRYKLRDIDGSADNAAQAVALQYRVGESGNFVNVPAGFVADASTGPSLATAVTDVVAVLPAAVNGQAQIQVRIITTNAVGNDEWTGIDDIAVSSVAGAPPPAMSLAYDGSTLSEARTLDGAIAGKLMLTLNGETFTGANGDDLLAGGKATAANVPAGLTAVLMRTSATTAELSLTGSAAAHGNAADVANLGLTFGNTAFIGGNAAAVSGAARGDLRIDFADAGTPGAVQTFTPNVGTSQDSSDASTALALDGNWMIVADDEASVLRVYPRGGGAAVTEWSYASNGPMLTGGELDLEGSTRIGDTLYFIGSHGNARTGAEANSREFIFAATVNDTGAQTQFGYVGQYGGLEAALAAWDSGNAHGRGADFFGLAASSANGVVPEAVSGFSIEGLSASADGSQLLIAFRAPQADTAARDLALVVPVAVTGLLAGNAAFGAPMTLDLGGRGIRSLEKSPSGDYLILAGPAGGASAEVTHDFRLYRWDGASSTATGLDVDLDALVASTGGSLETLVDVLGTGAGTLVQLLQDNGDTVWPGQTLVSKDLAAAQQMFQGHWIALGANAAADTTVPTLTSSTPADNAATASASANLVLRFSEGVEAGSGSFVIRTTDGTIVQTIAANSAAAVFAYNAVTLNPAADFAPSAGYYVETTGTAVLDHAGNAWSGLSGPAAFNFSTAAPAAAPRLLITEVNSNAAGGDFFELFNYGSTAIDLAGFKWIDSAANFNDAGAVTFPTFSLAPGGKLVVVSGTDATAFRTAWNNLPTSVDVLALGGPGLGGGDGVTVFDATGNVVAAFNYRATAITASDGTIIQPAVRGDGAAITGSVHAGPAVGATANGVSAVWNEQSTAAPKYVAAQAGQFGGVAQGGAAANIGSPGAAAGTSLATPYVQNFASGLGDFTAFSVDSDAARTWANVAGTADVNGFGDAAPADDWLISRAFDLSSTDVETFSFTTWTNFADAGTPNPEVRLKVSTNYSGTGSPTAATWTELAFTPSPEGSRQVTPSGVVDLSGIVGSKVHFAFQYSASGTGGSSSSQWRVDDVRLEGFQGAVLSVAATNAVRVEGDTGSTPFTFTVTRTGDLSGASTVQWAIGGAAVDGADFGGALPSGSLSFAAGEASKTISVAVTGDSTIEASENFTVNLSGATGATIAAASATGTIQTDDVLLTRIHAVQGSGSASTMVGHSVSLEGILTAYLPGVRGFFMQEEAADFDTSAATSEGIFVFYNTTTLAGLGAASVGDIVRVTGTVTEFNGLTEITTPANFTLVADNPDGALPPPVEITLPVAAMVDWEAVEGMRVAVSSGTTDGQLVVTDNFNLGQFGQVTLTSDALIQQFTELNAPSASGWTAYQATVQRDQVIVDDGNSAQNPDPNIFGRGGNQLTASNTLRAGDTVSTVVGVVDQFSNGSALGYETTYRVQATSTVDFTGAVRPTTASFPDAVTGAEIKVASANVLNYFTTFGSTSFTTPNGTSHQGRGAGNATEFARQRDKIVANLVALEADVLGLMEMQNNGFADGTSALDSLVDALNASTGAGTYAYIAGPFLDNNGADSATAGDDAIMSAIVYKAGRVAPVGRAAVPDVSLPAHDAFTATFGSRVPVAQTFRAIADGEMFTVVVNHFKSKGSVIDPDTGDGQGANNLARMEAARDLLAWVATNPTGATDPDVLLLGDFNAYGKEDPVAYIDANGYDKISTGLSYSFDGLWGSLDHVFASDSLARQVAGSIKWASNAEEPTALDYNTDFKSTNHDALLYAPDAYRASDHNPILVGLNLGKALTAEDQAPALAVAGSPGVVGDGNGDGIADSSQPAVLSTTLNRPGTTPASFTLVADSTAGKAPAGSPVEITGLSQAAAPANQPAPMAAPVGTIDFTAAIGAPGGTETFSTYVDAALGVNGYWQQNPEGFWVNLAGRAYGGQVVSEGNKLRLDFGITDGGAYDSDGRADGVVTHAGVLGYMQLSIVGWQPDVTGPGLFLG